MLNPDPKSQYLCIVDYNLSRLSDVKLITDYAKERYKLKTILFRANPTKADNTLADIVINLGPLQKDFVSLALQYLEAYKGQIAAVVPFSDDSVVSGSALAEALELKADNSKLATRAFSKSEYRLAENQIRTELETQNLFIPRSKLIFSVEELKTCLEQWHEIVLKPTCEGNNRGVIRLRHSDSVCGAFEEVRQYIHNGLIAEEVISFPQEFSIDGIAGLSFCTRKISHFGRYPVEYGQIVPARISDSSLKSLSKASSFANLIVGQHLGPFHNELKHDPLTLKSAVVEPNRRPAGMRIWHLAERVYGINFFKLWVDHLMGHEIPTGLPPVNKIAGIRMLKAPSNGLCNFNIMNESSTTSLLNSIEQKVKLQLGVEFRTFDFQWNIGPEAKVTSEPKDNSQFIAQICFETTHTDSNLEEVMAVWASEFEGYIEPHIKPKTKTFDLPEVIA